MKECSSEEREIRKGKKMEEWDKHCTSATDWFTDGPPPAAGSL